MEEKIITIEKVPRFELDKDISYVEARSMVNRSLGAWVTCKINYTEKTFFFGYYYRKLKFVGKKFFVSTTKCTDFSRTKTGKFYGTASMLREYQVYNELGLEWTKEVPATFLDKPSIAYAIIFGKYTNAEDLIKAYVKRYFKGAFSWKSVQEYCKHYKEASLSDLIDFTTNPQEALKIVLRDYSDNTYKTFIDLLKGAIELGEPVNPLWSIKRMEAEHLKQIRILNLYKLEHTSKDIIYDENTLKLLEYPGLEILSNEYRCCKEGLNMDNCIHSIHWRLLKEKRRIAFHMYVPERACLEFIINPDHTLTLTDIRGPHNNNVSLETEYLAQVTICQELNKRNIGKLVHPEAISTDFMF